MRVLGILFACSGLTAVALGAMGAHVLEPQIAPPQLKIWEKAVHYQLFHTLALGWLLLVLSRTQRPSLLILAAWLMVAGIVFFSGSLYLLSTRDISGWNPAWLGPVTPLGGLCWITAWLMMAVAFVKKSIP
ncbi:MAG: DUF423 domain-containing protein [Flavobacteriales bacterium]|nr:DUF423 domain-containing protein [Flavobacteriales bacterium]